MGDQCSILCSPPFILIKQYSLRHPMNNFTIREVYLIKEVEMRDVK